MLFFKKRRCKKKGHDWELRFALPGMRSHNEWVCKRCGHIETLKDRFDNEGK